MSENIQTAPITEPVVETPVTPVVETTPAVETTPVIPPVEQVTPQPFLKIKYNHVEEELDEETARNLAQMGKKFPELKAKLDAIEAEKQNEKLQLEADEFYIDKGILIDDPITRLNYYKVEKEIKEKQALDNQFNVLKSKYPTLKDENITPDMIANFKEKGIPFIASYELNSEKSSKSDLERRLAEAESKLATIAKNEENKGSAVGSASNGGSSDTVELTAESLDKMSQKEMASRWEEITKFLKMKK